MPALSELVGRTAELGGQAAAFGDHVTARIMVAGDVPNVTPGEPPGGAKLLQIAGWIGWAVFLACVVGVFIICIKMGINAHNNRAGGGGGEEAGKLFWPLLGCIIGSGAGAILGAVT